MQKTMTNNIKQTKKFQHNSCDSECVPVDTSSHPKGLLYLKKNTHAHIHTRRRGKRKEWLLYAHTYRSILVAAGHIILTPANQLMVMGLKTWSLSNAGLEPATF
jgi:hypothetical protein